MTSTSREIDLALTTLRGAIRSEMVRFERERARVLEPLDDNNAAIEYPVQYRQAHDTTLAMLRSISGDEPSSSPTNGTPRNTR